MFLNPLLLLGVGAAAIPLALHLLSRARYRDVDWGAMMFLQGADARQRQSARLSQWLLLLVRGATAGLLAVALARPVLRSTWAGAIPEGEVDVAIVLDCSGSMGYDEAGRTRLDAARAAARKILEGLQPGDRATLVCAGADAGAEADVAPTADLRSVADRIGAARAGYGRANLAAALEEAAARLRGDATRLVYVVCDRQANSWEGVDPAFADSWRRRTASRGAGAGPTRLLVVPVGGTDTQNVTLESMQLLTVPAIRGQPTDVELRVRNRGPVRWAALPVALRVGNRRLPDQQVNLGPDSVTNLRVTTTFDAPGSHVLSAVVRSPGMTFDDRYQLAVEAVEPLKVLVLSGDERAAGFRSESTFLRVALAPYRSMNQSGPDPCVVTVTPTEKWSDVRLKDFQVVVLANVERFTAAQVREIEQFVYDGGGLVAAPGNLSRVEEWNASLYRSGAGVLPGELRPPTPSDGSAATALLGIELDHPLFAFARGRVDPLPPSTIARYFPATRRRPDAGVRSLAEYGTGDPFLIEGQSGRGRVLLVTTPLDADWSTLPLSNFYLPFVQSAVRYAATGAIPERNLRPGEPLQASLESTAEPRTASLQLPDGSRQDLTVLRFGGRDEVRFADTRRPGHYRLTLRGGGAPDLLLHYIVPTPREESDLTQLTAQRWRELEQQLGLRRIDPEAAPATDPAAAPRGGRELWAPAVGAVLALAACELLIARRLGA